MTSCEPDRSISGDGDDDDHDGGDAKDYDSTHRPLSDSIRGTYLELLMMRCRQQVSDLSLPDSQRGEGRPSKAHGFIENK